MYSVEQLVDAIHWKELLPTVRYNNLAIILINEIFADKRIKKLWNG